MNFGMIPTFQMTNPLYSSTVPLVSNVEEAKSYPSPFNSEIFLKDSADETLLYIKKTDVNGVVSVKRYRYFEDPEPTQQEINDERYITKVDFDKQIQSLRNDIFEAINKNKGKYMNGNKSNKDNV